MFGVHIKGACNRVPCLEKIGIKSTVCGPESFTPGMIGSDISKTFSLKIITFAKETFLLSPVVNMFISSLVELSETYLGQAKILVIRHLLRIKNF